MNFLTSSIRSVSTEGWLAKLIRLGMCFTIPLAAAFLTAGCGKNDSSGNKEEQVVALTPLAAPSQACARGQTHPMQWDQSQHRQYNFVPYGYDYNGQPIAMGPYANQMAQHGFCGCPTGSHAMCDPRFGLVCVPVQQLLGHNIAWWQLEQSAFSFRGYSGYAGYGHVLNNPIIYWGPAQAQQAHHRHRRQTHNAQYQVQFSLSCATRVGQTCQVGVYSCGENAFCRPLAPNSSLGICAR